MKRFLFVIAFLAALPTSSFAQFWPGDSGKSLDAVITSCTIAASSAKDAKTQTAIFDACVSSHPAFVNMDPVLDPKPDHIIPDVIMNDVDKLLPEVIMDDTDKLLPEVIMKPKG